MCPRSRSHPKGRPEADPHSGKMATALRLPLRLSAAKLCVRAPKPGARAAHVPRWTQNRTAVSTPSGAILPKPDKVSLIFSRLPTAEPQRNRAGGPKPGRHPPGPVGRLRSAPPHAAANKRPLAQETRWFTEVVTSSKGFDLTSFCFVSCTFGRKQPRCSASTRIKSREMSPLPEGTAPAS